MTRGRLVLALIGRGLACWLIGAGATGLMIAVLFGREESSPTASALFWLNAAGVSALVTLPAVGLAGVAVVAWPAYFADRPTTAAACVAGGGIALAGLLRDITIMPFCVGFVVVALAYAAWSQVRPRDPTPPAGVAR